MLLLYACIHPTLLISERGEDAEREERMKERGEDEERRGLVFKVPLLHHCKEKTRSLSHHHLRAKNPKQKQKNRKHP